MDKNYWEKYYNKDNLVFEPSNFAEYIYNKFLTKHSKIIELGCGSGRDSIYFSSKDIKTLAVDQCSNVEKLIKSHTNMNNLKFMCCDFTSLNDLGKFDGVYSRFTMHAINEQEEDNVINWVNNCLVSKGKFFIEARSTKNELYKKGKSVENEKNTYIYNQHKRRFIDMNIFCNKLKHRGFRILEACEDKNFAIHNKDNHTFMRVVAEKI